MVFLVTLAFPSNVLSQASKSGHCPMARTVTNCFNRCKSDYECSFDKKCCPNACGSTSCAESSPISYGSDLRDYNESIYCDNVKCHTGRNVCLILKPRGTNAYVANVTEVNNSDISICFVIPKYDVLMIIFVSLSSPENEQKWATFTYVGKATRIITRLFKHTRNTKAFQRHKHDKNNLK